MLTEERIEQNKQTFIGLINSITRDGARKSELISKLENSDFFTAPASTKYHASYAGGLCEHSLNVYNSAVKLVEAFNLTDVISSDSLLITCLLHDISKMNFYETSYRNKKQYSDYGSKHDDGGRFDWVVEKSYAVIPEENRFLYGNHEETSEFMIRSYMPLSYEESVAILHHHAGMSWDCAKDNLSAILNRYPLATILHLADMASCYILERINE